MPPSAASIGSPIFVTGFLVLIGVLLAIDLGLVNRRAHAIGTREALLWSSFFVGLSLVFNLWIYLRFGPQPGLEFLTGYLIEYALSVDNIFVFLVIFNYFGVPPQYQHRVLFWGILGAIVLRATFIVAGAALITAFHWVIYIFGAFLLLTGLKILVQKETEVHPERNPVLRLFRKLVPLVPEYEGQRFFVRRASRLMATPLMLVLVLVEATDVVFAVDSIPAIFGITRDPFIVFTSNIFAILGLRALYFLLASVVGRFHYLKFGLGLVLVFIGAKMVASDLVHVPIGLSLGVVAALLGGSVLLSALFPQRPGPPVDAAQEVAGAAEPPSSEPQRRSR
jgi:tellurite resistance protein TerC